MVRHFPAGSDGRAQRPAQLMVKLVLPPQQTSLSPLISCHSASTNWRPSFLPSFLLQEDVSPASVSPWWPLYPNPAAWDTGGTQAGATPPTELTGHWEGWGRLPRVCRGEAVVTVSPFPNTSTPPCSTPGSLGGNTPLYDMAPDVTLVLPLCAVLQMQ